MGCESGQCNKTSILCNIFVMPSLEGWPTKVKEATSPHEVRLTLLDTNPAQLKTLDYLNKMKLFYETC